MPPGIDGATGEVTPVSSPAASENLPPAEWADREALWNAVEEAEKTKDSRLAREFVVALPVELNRDGWITLLTDFIEANFVAKGMCADDAGMSVVKNHIAKMENDLQTLEQQDKRYSVELTAALTEYGELTKQAESIDLAELDTARQSIRPDIERKAIQHLQNGYGKRYDAQKLRKSQEDVATMLGEAQQKLSVRQQIQQWQETQSHTSQKRQSRDQER